MQDAWRAYLELAFGLTEASRRKAREVAREVLGKGEATAAQVQSFVDDLVSTSRTNREGLARLVRYEVDRALGAVGLASSDEVAELTARLREVERRLAEAESRGSADSGSTATPAAPAPVTSPTASSPAAKKPMAKKAVAKKAVAKKAAAKKPVAKQTAAKNASKKAAATPRPTGKRAT